MGERLKRRTLKGALDVFPTALFLETLQRSRECSNWQPAVLELGAYFQGGRYVYRECVFRFYISQGRSTNRTLDVAIERIHFSVYSLKDDFHNMLDIRYLQVFDVKF